MPDDNVAPDHLHIETVAAGSGIVEVRATGEIDMGTAPLLGSRLDELWRNGTLAVVLDLTEVTFVDSAGVAMLARASKAAEKVGTAVEFKASAQVMQTLDLAGVVPLFGGRRAADDS
jgi:anti-anti-sigma factor